MTVISGVDYLGIANDYAKARNNALAVAGHLFEAVYKVVMLNEIIPEVDLLIEFFDSYQINADIFKAPVTFLSAVRTLNNHVLNRSAFTTLDEYFDDQGIIVPKAWADLSSANGRPISNLNII